jgi:hypothetical protein
VDGKGRALSPEVVFSEFGDKALEQCLISKVSTWEFPRPPMEKERYIEHVFDFKDSPDADRQGSLR